MREVKVVQEGSVWEVQIVDGERIQRFTCATEAQAQSLGRVMAKAEESRKPSSRASAGDPQ
jgi:hypothetical protein